MSRLRSDRTTRERAVLEALVGNVEGLDTAVDPRDEMMRVLRDDLGSRGWFDYFRQGQELVWTIEQIANWAFPGERDRISVLEFACGYGRIVRHLVRSFPAANVSASDIDAGAVAFVTEQLGVTGKLSAAEPEQLDWDERYDLVVVPSLFSHLPDRTFARWLGFLHGLLTERGVLAFSVHGEELEPGGDFSEGIVYRPINEAPGRLDPEEYGSATVTEGYVADRIEGATGARRYARVERAFWDFQDVYLLTGPAQREPRSFAFVPPISGHVDRVSLSRTRVEVSGWARATEPGLRVRICAGGALLHETDRFDPRPDVVYHRGDAFLHTGFAARADLPRAARAAGFVVVEAETERQARCLYAGGSTPDRGETVRKVARMPMRLRR
jgi:SAM-dependent methyltransferase